MAIQDDKTILSKQDLKEYHNRILPYLGGNMMMSTNNSDYYSTDEKVVGVWTDGKPIYQKTITGTTPAVNSTTYIPVNASIDKGWISNSFLEDGFGNCIGITPLVRNGDNVTQMRAIVKNNSASSNKNTIQINNYSTTSASSWLNVPVYVTVQYTKTTDTTSTSLTTPGAYDINFPNTWPENKEIYFGNGVYGQRFTGTITAAVNTRHIFDLTNTGTNRQPRIISCGGWWCRDTNIAALNIGQNDNNQESSSILVGMIGNISLETKSANPRTNSPYEVWVTYIK